MTDSLNTDDRKRVRALLDLAATDVRAGRVMMRTPSILDRSKLRTRITELVRSGADILNVLDQVETPDATADLFADPSVASKNGTVEITTKEASHAAPEA